jgi:glycosyltransferase involved in cell wall biosynthesis
MSRTDLEPGVSVLTTTYNRADVLGRAIDSVLAQDTDQWELVVVDNGSTDETQELLARYDHPRITKVLVEVNRGCTGGRNVCLDHIGREWFTFLDSDDRLVPHALSTLLAVPERVDPTIDAISCNSIDSETLEFTGMGLDHDQWLDQRTIMSQCGGEFWGITKTTLLGDRRFNEKIQKEGILWFKLDRIARRYYIHQGLCIYNTARGDRESARQAGNEVSCYPEYVAFLEEEREFLEAYKECAPRKYSGLLFRAFTIFLAAGDRERAASVYRELCEVGRLKHRMVARVGLTLGPGAIDSLRRVRDVAAHH